MDGAVETRPVALSTKLAGRASSGRMSARSIGATFALLALGCGGARAAAAPQADATSAGHDAVEVPAEQPCTAWDPSADPTIAPADVAAPPETARRGASGLRFCILRPGEGPRPTAEDTVRVHYTGWTTDGEMFDSSHTRGQPLALGVSAVIAGWTQALTHMQVGEVRRLWIPEALAYRGQEGMPAGMLVFDVELVGIEPR